MLKYIDLINFLGNPLNVGLQRKIDKINKLKT